MRRAVIILVSAFLAVGLTLPMLANDEVASLFERASSLTNGENYEEAVEIYEYILKQHRDHPRAPQAGMMIGHIFTKHDDRDTALAFFKYVAEAYPDSEQASAAKSGVAHTYIALDQTDAAIREFTELVENYTSSPQAPQAQMRIAHLYIKKREKARTDAQKAKSHENAYNAFDLMLKLFPEERNLCAEAVLHKSAIKFEKALDKKIPFSEVEEEIEVSLKVCSDAPNWILARLGLMYAQVALLDKKDDETVVRAEEVIKKYPECRLEVGWAQILAMSAYKSLNNHQMALKYCNDIIEAKYTKEENYKDRNITLMAQYQKANIYRELFQFDKARELFEKIIEEHPNTVQGRLSKHNLDRMGSPDQ